MANLNEDIDITEYPDPDPEADIGPWIYEKPFPRPEGGFQKYDLNNYCKDRVFCRSGYKADGCKTPIKCVPITGGKKTKRRKARKSRRR
jgi:hypothetical protein